MHRSALDFTATIRRLRIDCNVETRELALVGLTSDDEKRLRREWQSRKAAGVEAAFLNARQVGARLKLEGSGALHTRDHARLDPYRACLGFARAAAARDAQLFEHAPVRRIRFGRRSVQLRTERGIVTARAVVVATERATDLFRPLKRHFKPLHRYHVVTPPLPAAVRRELGPELVAISDTASPPRWVQWLRDGRVICSGGDQPEAPQRAREKALVQRTGQLM